MQFSKLFSIIIFFFSFVVGLQIEKYLSQLEPRVLVLSLLSLSEGLHFVFLFWVIELTSYSHSGRFLSSVRFPRNCLKAPGTFLLIFSRELQGQSLMDNPGSDSFLRNRRFDSFFNTSSEPNVKDPPPPPKISVKEEVGFRPRANNEYVDDDGLFSALISYVRIVTCFLTMMVTTLIWAFIMLVLLPWPYERIRQGNIYGHVTGRLLMWILGNPIKIEGAEFSNKRAIYISNHASPIDIFLIMWLTPTGTVGIAKKEIIWYPLFGQLYVLAKHIRIDRSNPTAAIQSMKEAADAIVKNNLSLIIFPEGTRSKNGRLLPFKKGFVHMALQSRLPIVPIVLTGTHLAWRKGSLHVRPAPITVKYLPPISTSDWVADKIDDYIKMVHDVYVKNLPEPQKPVV